MHRELDGRTCCALDGRWVCMQLAARQLPADCKLRSSCAAMEPSATGPGCGSMADGHGGWTSGDEQPDVPGGLPGR